MAMLLIPLPSSAVRTAMKKLDKIMKLYSWLQHGSQTERSNPRFFFIFRHLYDR